jgi:hypothetical protein
VPTARGVTQLNDTDYLGFSTRDAEAWNWLTV